MVQKLFLAFMFSSLCILIGCRPRKDWLLMLWTIWRGKCLTKLTIKKYTWKPLYPDGAIVFNISKVLFVLILIVKHHCKNIVIRQFRSRYHDGSVGIMEPRRHVNMSRGYVTWLCHMIDVLWLVWLGMSFWDIINARKEIIAIQSS